MSGQPSASEFLVFSRGQWDPDVSPAAIDETIDAFYRWLDGMIETGRMKPGQRLSSHGRTVGRGIPATDGPFGESKEAIGGYWFILAGSLEEAAALAAGNPCIALGLFFEVRPVDHERGTAANTETEHGYPRRAIAGDQRDCD